MSCKKYQLLIKNSLSGALSPDDQKVLAEHTAVCPECRALLKINSMLGGADFSTPMPGQDEFTRMRADILNKIRQSEKARKIDLAILWQKFRANAWRPAVAFSLILGFLLGRIMPTEESSLSERIVDGISLLAAQSKNLFSEDKAGYRYSNVNIKEIDNNQVQMSFDVSTHVDGVWKKQDPLYKEVIAHTLLAPGNAGTRLKAISSMDDLRDPRVKQALILAINNDPSLAVRMAAADQLQHFPKDDDIIKTMKDILQKEESIKMGMVAVDYLTKYNQPSDSLDNVIKTLDKSISKPIKLRREKLLKIKKESE